MEGNYFRRAEQIKAEKNTGRPNRRVRRALVRPVGFLKGSLAQRARGVR
jgi:hypothetical protein